MADLVTALTTALGTTATSIMGALGDILPIALPITGAVIAVNLGIKFFRRVAK